MLSAQLLDEVRRFAPLMELRGFSMRDWALSAGTSELTLKRYLSRRCRVGDEETLMRLLHETECFIVVRPDGPLSEAWSASLKAMVESSFENALRH
ncbi:MAG: hypothetical protein H0W78_15740 [Planctomycetes bacterium]|jgi:hypothetical protein|nr:hypothetical protein [Planctomycetota bacterium]